MSNNGKNPALGCFIVIVGFLVMMFIMFSVLGKTT